MVAWGHGTFHNDDAADWLYELEDGGLEVVEAALQAVIFGGEPAAPDCCTALAAAEVVAAMHGKPGTGLPDELYGWLRERRAPPSAALLARARKAVAIVLAESELRDLWLESGELVAWQTVVQELAARLE